MTWQRTAAGIDEGTRQISVLGESDATRVDRLRTDAPSDFVGRLRDSRMLPPAILEAAIEDSAATNIDNVAPAERLRRYLLENDLLTTAQLERIAQGGLTGVYLGPYQLLRAIGAGGTSRVFLAEHVQIQRRVALKVLDDRAAADPATHRRFLREAHVFMALNHPNIVRAYQFDESHGRPYLALEYVEGENLRDRVVRTGPLSFVLAASFIAQAAGALSHLHAGKFVHRDVKPGNLVATKSNRIKLIDLGLVGGQGGKLLVSDAAHSSGGSVDYIAPEQISRFHEVDARADLYALGCSLYCLLTGAPPFARGTASEKLARHLKEMPRPVEDVRGDVPTFLRDLCRSLMAKDPAARPQTAAEVHRRALDWLRGQGAPVGSGSGIVSAPTASAPAGSPAPASVSHCERVSVNGVVSGRPVGSTPAVVATEPVAAPLALAPVPATERLAGSASVS
ncbi:MAG TPA: serine/threonine-protein kinase, partial [Pirellulales bacterium]